MRGPWAIVHDLYVHVSRTLGFAAVHASSPVCNDLMLRQERGVRECASCGWRVEFHERSPQVASQVTIDEEN